MIQTAIELLGENLRLAGTNWHFAAVRDIWTEKSHHQSYFNPIQARWEVTMGTRMHPAIRRPRFGNIIQPSKSANINQARSL
jgi:hypothetical protein